MAGWRTLPRLRARLEPRVSARTGRLVVLGAVVCCLLIGGVAAAIAVEAPLDRNAAYADKYERAYQPIESASFDDALVFVPTPYGEWHHHPFQQFRNDPDFDGEVVYALDRGPEDDFAVIDAYPDRTLHRYTYQGEWTANANRHVVPKLERLDVRSGPTMDAETTVGVPDRVDRVRVRLEAEGGGDDRADYVVEEPGDSVRIDWTLDGDAARLSDDPDTAVSIDDADVVVVTATLVQPDGATLTYRQEATVRTTDERVEVVWPPERTVCPLVTDCGTEGTYLSDAPDAHPEGVAFETRIERTEE